MKERQCKFPLACILRQSWQDEVITEWLTHQHGEDLSPPGREIAKSQFTHIQLQLPVRAWSRSWKTVKPHTDTLTPYSHMRALTHPHARKLRRGTAANHNWEQRLSPALFHMYAVRVRVCYHMPRPSPCFLSNTPSSAIKASGMTVLCRCVYVWKRERARERIGETDDTRVLFNLHPLFE